MRLHVAKLTNHIFVIHKLFSKINKAPFLRYVLFFTVAQLWTTCSRHAVRLFDCITVLWGGRAGTDRYEFGQWD